MYICIYIYIYILHTLIDELEMGWITVDRAGQMVGLAILYYTILYHTKLYYIVI